MSPSLIFIPILYVRGNPPYSSNSHLPITMSLMLIPIPHVRSNPPPTHNHISYAYFFNAYQPISFTRSPTSPSPWIRFPFFSAAASLQSNDSHTSISMITKIDLVGRPVAVHSLGLVLGLNSVLASILTPDSGS